MPEETKADVVLTEKAETPAVDAKVLIEQIEQIKKAQAGSDKAYQETMKQKLALEAELEKIKKEKMSEKEKAEYELAQQRAALEAKSKEVADATLRLSKMKLLGERAVPIEFAEYIGGSNEDELKTNLDTFLKRFEEAVGKRVNEKLSGAKAPEAGNTVDAQPLPEDWRVLEKRYQGRP